MCQDRSLLIIIPFRPHHKRNVLQCYIQLSTAKLHDASYLLSADSTTFCALVDIAKLSEKLHGNGPQQQLVDLLSLLSIRTSLASLLPLCLSVNIR